MTPSARDLEMAGTVADGLSYVQRSKDLLPQHDLDRIAAALAQARAEEREAIIETEAKFSGYGGRPPRWHNIFNAGWVKGVEDFRAAIRARGEERK